jgi:hypothetical protein
LKLKIKTKNKNQKARSNKQTATKQMNMNIIENSIHTSHALHTAPLSTANTQWHLQLNAG